MMNGMKAKVKFSDAGPLRIHTLCASAVLCLVGLVLASCASAPEYPVYPAPTTRIVSVGFESAFMAALKVLREDARLDLHTIDKAGKFLAWEKTSGFMFFRHRTVFDIALEPVGEDKTKITMTLRAENYDMGGFTREAGWYPSSEVDAFMGEDILSLIEKEIAKAAS